MACSEAITPSRRLKFDAGDFSLETNPDRCIPPLILTALPQTRTPVPLLTLCIRYVAVHAMLIDSLAGFPELIGQQIFECIVHTTTHLDDPQRCCDLLRLFGAAYGSALLSCLALRGAYPKLGDCPPAMLQFQCVQRLDLSGCRVGEEWLLYLSRIELLTDLRLAGCSMTDEAVRKLSAVVRVYQKGSTQLRAIDLSDNPLITSRSARFLCRFSRLRAINLSNTAVQVSLGAWALSHPEQEDGVELLMSSLHLFLACPDSALPWTQPITCEGWAADTVRHWLKQCEVVQSQTCSPWGSQSETCAPAAVILLPGTAVEAECGPLAFYGACRRPSKMARLSVEQSPRATAPLILISRIAPECENTPDHRSSESRLPTITRCSEISTKTLALSNVNSQQTLSQSMSKISSRIAEDQRMFAEGPMAPSTIKNRERSIVTDYDGLYVSTSRSETTLNSSSFYIDPFDAMLMSYIKPGDTLHGHPRITPASSTLPPSYRVQRAAEKRPLIRSRGHARSDSERRENRSNLDSSGVFNKPSTLSTDDRKKTMEKGSFEGLEKNVVKPAISLWDWESM